MRPQRLWSFATTLRERPSERDASPASPSVHTCAVRDTQNRNSGRIIQERSRWLADVIMLAARLSACVSARLPARLPGRLGNHLLLALLMSNGVSRTKMTTGAANALAVSAWAAWAASAAAGPLGGENSAASCNAKFKLMAIQCSASKPAGGSGVIWAPARPNVNRARWEQDEEDEEEEEEAPGEIGAHPGRANQTHSAAM